MDRLVQRRRKQILSRTYKLCSIPPVMRWRFRVVTIDPNRVVVVSRFLVFRGN